MKRTILIMVVLFSLIVTSCFAHSPNVLGTESFTTDSPSAPSDSTTETRLPSPTLPDGSEETSTTDPISTQPKYQIPEPEIKTLAPYTAAVMSYTNNLLYWDNPPKGLTQRVYDHSPYPDRYINFEDDVPETITVTINGREYIAYYYESYREPGHYYGEHEIKRSYFAYQNNLPGDGKLNLDYITLSLWTNSKNEITSYQMYDQSYAPIDQDKTKLCTMEECQRIAESMLEDFYLSKEPDNRLSDYTLTATYCEADEYHRPNRYCFNYRRQINGYNTNDSMSVGVTEYGTVSSIFRGSHFSPLEIDFERADAVAAEFLIEVAQYVRNGSPGVVYLHYIARCYDGSYYLHYLMTVKQEYQDEKDGLMQDWITFQVAIGL